MGATGIPYLTRIWQIVTGCTPISEGCQNCYAQALAHRWRRSFEPTAHVDRLDQPAHWRGRHVVGVGFHGDLFHASIPDDFLLAAFTFMARTPQHTYIVPTKRAKRMADFLERMGGTPPANIWWIVSVENQARAEERIPELLRVHGCTGASLAPQIGPVDLDALDRPRIGWVVQECESGPQRRPFDLAWARQVRDACARAGVPYYLKQIPHGGGGQLEIGESWAHRIVEKPFLDGLQHLDLPWVKP
jgi:protein gp37